ncbi:S9 family peptidase, partial [Bacteroides sp. OttesenSCG-928-M17]|nr:S9 family peptidase [Bacteroides sp. OttesenSCG-928-M17]
MAQKPTPTLEELIPGGSNYCFTENIYGLQWWGDICIKPGIDSIYTIDPQSGKEKLLITRESLNHALTEKGFKKLSHLQSVSFPWSDRTEFLIPQRNTYITYNFVKDRIESVVTVKEGAQNKEYNTANGNVAYTIGNNLYINDTAVTNETKEGIVCG